MKKTLLSLAIATGITLTAASSTVAAADTKFDPWNQLVNVAHEYRAASDRSGAIWANLEYNFDKKTNFDSWDQLVNVAHDYRGGSGAIWASFERGFDNIKPVTIVVQAPVVAPATVLTQNVWTHYQITGVGFTTKI